MVGLIGLGTLGGIHLGPRAIEPPHDIISPYRSRILGYIAFGWVLGLLGALFVTAVYSARQWRRVRAT